MAIAWPVLPRLGHLAGTSKISHGSPWVAFAAQVQPYKYNISYLIKAITIKQLSGRWLLIVGKERTHFINAGKRQHFAISTQNAPN